MVNISGNTGVDFDPYESKTEINLSDMNDGVYYLGIIIDKRVIVKRVIKQQYSDNSLFKAIFFKGRFFNV